MDTQTIGYITLLQIEDLWSRFFAFFPSFVGALILLVIGLFVASVLKFAAEALIKGIKLDAFLKRGGLEQKIEKAGIRLNSAAFFGFIVYWFFVLVTVFAVSDVLGLIGLTLFLNEAIAYIFNNVFVSILILLATILIANFIRNLVVSGARGARLHGSHFVGLVTWWAIIVFGVGATLDQLGVAQTFVNLVNHVVMGLILMVAVAGGIAFGLGGKDYASHLLSKLREGTEER